LEKISKIYSFFSLKINLADDPLNNEAAEHWIKDEKGALAKG
jgi:hypothetical protein